MPADTSTPAPSTFSGLTANEAVQQAGPYLAYLSELAGEVGVADPVETYLRPLVCQWDELSAEAGSLRHAAEVAGEVSERVSGKLGRLDAGWSGGHADAFVTYMGEIGAAGGDVREAFDVLAKSLDELVRTIQHLVVQLVEVLTDAAELTSESASLPVGGANRARVQLQETHEAAKSFYEAARDVLEDFKRLCDGIDGPDPASRSVEINHRYPSERFAPEGAESASSAASGEDGATTASAAHDANEPRQTGARDPEQHPAQALAAEPAPADPAAAQQSQGTTAMPVIPMGFGGMQGGGGGGRRQSKTRPTTKPSELFGDQDRVVPPVIGPDPTKRA